MIKYYLVDNKLTPDPSDYRAVTQHVSSKDMPAIVELVKHRSVGVSESEIMSVLEEFFVAIEYLIRNGHRINTPFFNITPIVAGVFEGSEAPFEKGKHGINMNISAGIRLKRLSDQIAPERIRGSKALPIIDEAYDFASNTSNDLLTPGQPLKVRGENLKVDKDDPQQGVFFVNSADRSSTRASMYVESRNLQTVVLVPDSLPSGTYTLQVVALMSNELRKGELNASLNLL